MPEKQCLGYQIAIDPGSVKMGLAVFDSCGKYIQSVTLRADKLAPAGARLNLIRVKFLEYWKENFQNQPIRVTVIERLPPSQPRPSLPISPGAVVAVEFNYSTLSEEAHIPVMSWKHLARELGCDDKDPKGVGIFEKIGWDFKYPGSEDEADATMIFLCYYWNVYGYCWLGENKKAVKREIAND